MKINHIDLGKTSYPACSHGRDVTDPAFRLMCKKFGADMVYTEFVSSDALIRAVSKTAQKLNISDEERPVAIQIYGKDTETMVEAAKIVEQAQPDILDINFGCPVKEWPERCRSRNVAEYPSNAGNYPCCSGCGKNPRNGENPSGVGRQQQNYRRAGRTVTGLRYCRINHTRSYPCTNVHRRSGLDADRKVKNNPRMHIPIIGNGDVTTPQRCKECFDRYGVDAVMIGRASFGRPWIFKEMKHYLETGEELPPLSFEWCMEVLRQEVIDSVNLLDERKGILHVHKSLGYKTRYSKNPNFS